LAYFEVWDSPSATILELYQKRTEVHVIFLTA
jgi:hypothetical protein